MTLIHMADLHIKLKHDKRYKKDLISVVRFLLDIIDKHKPEYLFVAGDVFDTKIPTPAEMSLATAFIKRLIDMTQVIVIPGNHDIPAHEGSHHTLQSLENLKLKNLHILSDVAIHRIGSIDVLSLPYRYAFSEECMTTVKTLHDGYVGNSLFMIGHCWVNGYSQIEPPAGEFVVEKAFLASLTKVKYGALGHIHQGGHVVGNFYYSGAPFRITMAEDEPIKSVNVWADGRVAVLPTPAYKMVKFDINSAPNIDTITNSIVSIIAKDITVDMLPSLNNVRTKLEAQGNYVNINLELRKIAFDTVNTGKIDSAEAFIEDYVRKNNLMALSQKITSICDKIVHGNIGEETSVFSIEELAIKELPDGR